MKELSIEEKVKRYDKALEMAKNTLELANVNVDVKGCLESIFPELKESEDERIRKVIYGWIYTQPSQFFDNGFSKEEMLAWLEKQGEQKFAWSKDDEYNLAWIREVLMGLEIADKEFETKCRKMADWLKFVEDRIVPKP